MIETITLDTRKVCSPVGKPRISPIRRGERNNVTLTVTVRRDRKPYDLAGMTAHLVWQAADGKLVGPVPMEVTDPYASTVICTLPDACYAAVGKASAYIELRRGAELVDTTDEMLIDVLDCIDADGEQAEEYKPLIAEVREATYAATKAATRAESGEDERVANEGERSAAESARKQAETERANGWADLKADAEKTVEDAVKRSDSASDRATQAASSASAAGDAATAAAAKAETDTNAAVDSANASVSKAVADAKADVDAAVQRSDAATTKAETAVKTADSANAAATKAVTDAQTAIAEVKATEAKLYPAAENILVGSETGAVAHVEDAFNGASLRKIVVEGAAKQDGIPSPESPKPITVIEHPAVKVVGRNLWPFASSYTSIEGHLNEFVKEGTPFAILPGAYTFSAVGSLGNTDAPLFGYTAAGKRFQFFRILHNVRNPKYSFTVTEPITSVYFVSNAADSNTGTISSIQIERNSTATEYKPHTSQTLTFTLPAEHPYLAKLPDGTADEIVVDEEGNVELVARVSKATIVASKIVDTWGKGYAIYSWPKDGRYSPHATSDGTAVICDKLKAETGANIYRGLGIGISVGSTFANNKSCVTTIALGDGADLSSIDGAFFYYPLMTPVRYKLAPIEMPKAQDSIINVWADAEVAPNTGIEYVRDVNIVVSNLESAIASITEG